MEGTGAAEYRFLQDALQEDPNIKCTSMLVGNQYDARPRLSRVDEPARGFPTTREELFGYDVVICSDIARTAFTQEQLDWTVELVAKRGGGFAMIGGNTSFGSGGWDQTVWDGLIPVDMSGRGPQRSENYWGTFRVVIPPQAMDHPIWRIVDDPERNRQVLAALPNLLRHQPDRPTEAGRHRRSGFRRAPFPARGVATVFSCQTFGRGRTFAMSSDTTVDWGRDFENNWGEGDNRYFRKFWRNVVRWLAENSEASQQRLRVETDKVIYRPGQEIQITAKAYDEKIKETTSYRLVARVRGPSEPESHPFDATALRPHAAAERPRLPRQAAGSATGRDPGERRLDAAQVHSRRGRARRRPDRGDGRASTSRPSTIRPSFTTRARTTQRSSTLAKQTGGRAIQSPADLADLLGRHPDASVRLVVNRWPLWDHPLLWLFVLGFLASEWILRRRKGLA